MFSKAQLRDTYEKVGENASDRKAKVLHDLHDLKAQIDPKSLRKLEPSLSEKASNFMAAIRREPVQSAFLALTAGFIVGRLYPHGNPARPSRR